MPPHQIAGFIPKKLATDRYARSFRQLTRDVALAMQAKDAKILSHFTLVLEDGEKINVTTDRIAALRDQGRNPMWFVQEDWMSSTYGARSIGPAESATEPTKQDEAPEGISASQNQDILALYERQVERLEQEIEYLRGEGAIKNDQIRDSHERQRETNVLMRDLHGLMNTMQQRLLPDPQQSDVQRGHGEIMTADRQPAATAVATPRAKKGTTHKAKSRSQAAKASQPRAARKANQQEPSLLRKHTPTFHWALSRIFQRS